MNNKIESKVFRVQFRDRGNFILFKHLFTEFNYKVKNLTLYFIYKKNLYIKLILNSIPVYTLFGCVCSVVHVKFRFCDNWRLYSNLECNSVNSKYKAIKNKIIYILIDLDAIFPKCVKNISYFLLKFRINGITPDNLIAFFSV